MSKVPKTTAYLIVGFVAATAVALAIWAFALAGGTSEHETDSGVRSSGPGGPGGAPAYTDPGEPVRLDPDGISTPEAEGITDDMVPEDSPVDDFAPEEEDAPAELGTGTL